MRKMVKIMETKSRNMMVNYRFFAMAARDVGFLGVVVVVVVVRVVRAILWRSRDGVLGLVLSWLWERKRVWEE